MRRARGLLATAGLAATLLFSAASAEGADPARAPASDPVAARDQLKLGWQLAQDGKCDEALPHLTESLRLDPKAITLINLAQCEEKVGQLADALGHWVDARTRAQGEQNAAIEAEAEKRAKALEPRLAHLSIVVSKPMPPGATISRDGVVLGDASLGVATTVNPGGHVILVRAAGRRDARYEITLAEAETKSVEVFVGDAEARAAAPLPAAGGSGAKPLMVVGFGVAIAGAAVGGVTGVMALGKASRAKQDCPDLACPDTRALDDVETGRTLGTISTIGFVVAGVGAAVGIYAWLTDRKSAPQAARAGIFAAPTGSGLRGTF